LIHQQLSRLRTADQCWTVSACRRPTLRRSHAFFRYWFRTVSERRGWSRVPFH